MYYVNRDTGRSGWDAQSVLRPSDEGADENAGLPPRAVEPLKVSSILCDKDLVCLIGRA